MTDYFNRLDHHNLSPLWQVMSSLITPEPESKCEPFCWHYEKIRPLLMEAGGLITAKQAVRRVLVLENPGLRGMSKITTSLYAGLQLVLPGEVAPSHRHSQSALRFVLEGKGAHTTVSGERTFMQPGDFVITPPDAWHDHGNTTSEPMVWLDGLDIPVVQFFDASFVEDLGDDEQPVKHEAGYSQGAYANGLLPVDHAGHSLNSPIFNYPYERSRAALETLFRDHAPDPCHGYKMHYINPATGGHAMATMATFLQLLPKGFTTSTCRSTDATIFVCIEGRGSSTITGKRLDWGPRDIFVVPSWHKAVHRADEESVLFSFSDRAIQEKIGIWREDRGNRG